MTASDDITGVGYAALNDTKDGSGSNGSNNTAIGAWALGAATTGSNNIEISNAGAAADPNVVKIGIEGTQAKTFIAGI
jgi:hypothetical protein